MKLFTKLKDLPVVQEMKEAGLTRSEMVLEVLAALSIFAIPIGLLFLPELIK